MTDLSTRPLAVVTGASSGIGYELAKQFAQNGFDLVIAAEDAGIADAARTLAGSGAHVDGVQVDLATYDGVEELYGRVVAGGRPVAAAALNAGVGVGGDFARETDLDVELNLIALNVTSTVHLTKRLLKDMVARDSGRLLFTSSVVATTPGPYQAVYAASKAFVSSFAEGVRVEIKDTEVTITTLMPGATETEFFDRADLEDTKVGATDLKDDPAQVARQGFEALMAGKDHIVAGSLMTKAQGVMSAVLPERVTAAIHAKASEPGSADK